MLNETWQITDVKETAYVTVDTCKLRIKNSIIFKLNAVVRKKMVNTRVQTSLCKKANIVLQVMTVDKSLDVIISKSWLTLDVIQYHQHESQLHYYAIHC
jgi:hypothetical protein